MISMGESGRQVENLYLEPNLCAPGVNGGPRAGPTVGPL